MSCDYSAFERAYGREIPLPLMTLYENQNLARIAPVRFTFRDKPFVVEIQYFRAITDLVEQDVREDRFAFAVNTDGYDVLVDLTKKSLPILQREHGTADSIGVTLIELLAAPHLALGDHS